MNVQRECPNSGACEFFIRFSRQPTTNVRKLSDVITDLQSNQDEIRKCGLLHPTPPQECCLTVDNIKRLRMVVDAELAEDYKY